MEYQSKLIMLVEYSPYLITNITFNAAIGGCTDLVITDVTLEDNNAVYSHTAIGSTINSSVALNIIGKLNVCTFYSCNTGTSALPDMYARARGPQARGRVHTYQAKHEARVLQLLCNTMLDS